MNQTASRYSASVIVPAHNEQAVIGRLLSALPREIDGLPLQVIVACNGCSDDTAGVARSFGAEVIEVDAASKIAALNAGDAAAGAFPRLYVDADIGITSRAVVAIVRALRQAGTHCAAPPSRMELGGRPWLVRSYFRFWLQLMREREGYVGAGVYALSREGRARFAEFPDLIADDTFVRNLFTRDERRTVETDATNVEAPRTVAALFRRRVRVSIGNIQLATRAMVHSVPGSSEDRIAWWAIALSQPALIPHSVVYATINALAGICARSQLRRNASLAWGRDETTRSLSL